MSRLKGKVLLCIIYFIKCYETVSIDGCELEIRRNCFKDYRNKIEHDLRPYFQEEFNTLLHRYDQLNNELNTLTNLSTLVKDLEEMLQNHTLTSKDIFVSNNNISTQLYNINITMINSSRKLDKLVFDQKYMYNLEDLIKAAYNEAKAITNDSDVAEVKYLIENEIKAKHFLTTPLDVLNKSSNLMGLPHSIHADIELLEKLLMSPEKDIGCLKERSDTLKELFSNIVGTMNSAFISDINTIIANINKNENDFLLKNEDFIRKEGKYRKTCGLLNQTEQLAHNLNNIVDAMYNFKIDDSNDEDILTSLNVKQRLLEIEKEFETSCGNMDQKYSKMFQYYDAEKEKNTGRFKFI